MNSGPQTTTASGINTLVRRDLLRLLYQQAIPANFVNHSVTIAVAYGFWGVAPRTALITWTALAVTIATSVTALLLFYHHHKGNLTERQVEVFLRLRHIETLLTGGIWGSMAFFLMPGTPFEYQGAATLVLLGFSAGAIPINAAVFSCYIAYAVPLILPVLMFWLISGSSLSWLGYAGLPFLFSMLDAARRLASTTEQSLRLKYENLNLGTQLAYEVTERKRAEEKLELTREIERLSDSLKRRNVELTDALERAQESAKVRDAFLANMSHELRTPLNTIINVPEGLREDFETVSRVRCRACDVQFELDTDDTNLDATACSACGATGSFGPAAEGVVYSGDPARALRQLGSVERCGRQLLELITDVLDFSKAQAGRAVLRASWLRADEVLQNLRESLMPQAERRSIDLVIDLDAAEQQRTVWADGIKLNQILTNLVGNALKFSKERGTVRVSFRRDAASESVIFTVRDDGIGIDPAHHGLIFEPFRQVEDGHTRTYAGTGLGLTICKQLVELHGGTLSVQSVRGEGATFFVRLPVGPTEGAHAPDGVGG